MNRSLQRLLAALPSLAILAGLVVAAPAPAAAQAPDIREIPPHVMLLLDTSGSMEKRPGCACTTPECTECLPSDPTNGPVDPAVRNRWGIMLEALTGQIVGYNWAEIDRAAVPPTDPDFHYFIPHYQPRGETNLGNCTAAGGAISLLPPANEPLCQIENGILDVYRERVRFGLMTFDTVPTMVGESQLMFNVDYTATLGTCMVDGVCLNGSSAGGYSYGGPREFHYPGCGTYRMIDVGARNEGVGVPGGLVAMGQEGDPAEDLLVTNAAIQNSVLSRRLRPHGPTPIAGLFSDYHYYLEHHPDVVARTVPGGAGDPFNECRKRFAILLTDGRPNQDMRGAPIFCDAADPTAFCPYDIVEDQVADLITDHGTGPLVDEVYVVGFDVDPADCAGDARCEQEANDTIDTLNLIANAGDPDGVRDAIFANDRASLLEALAQILDATAPGATTRTAPAVGRGGATGAGQFQLNSGFQLERRPEQPWEGRLERHRVECVGAVPQQMPLDSAQHDLFHEELNAQSSLPGGLPTSPGYGRRLVTVRPSTLGNHDEHLYSNAETNFRTSHPGIPAMPSSRGDATVIHEGSHFLEHATTLTDAQWHVSTNPDIDKVELERWLYGQGGSNDPSNAAYNPRIGRRLGAIYHSSPTVVAMPGANTSDNSFNKFRDREEVVGRPTMTYVGTNDGILHAFVAVPHNFPATHPTYPSVSLDSGEELWGFIPPILQDKIDDVMTTAATPMVDATPVVSETLLARVPGETDEDYHATVLVGGLRAGGRGFYALDVTDPTDPKFLWQVTDSDFGQTYGRPVITQVRVDIGGVVHDRGVAILPGGFDVWDPAHGTAARAIGVMPDRGVAGRGVRRNWTADGDARGQTLLVVDILTGHVIRRFEPGVGPNEISAPLVGAVAAFPHGVGLRASRAYTTDADGVLWRVDLSDTDPDDWRIEPIYDMSHSLGATEGQAAYEAPILSTSDDGDLIIIHATGDIDHLEDTTAQNRVVSLTETVNYDPATGVELSVALRVNWEVDLDPGEQVTGPLSVFNERVYWGSFHSENDDVNSCNYGSSRLWGVHYLEEDPPNSLDPLPSLTDIGGNPTKYLDETDNPDLENALVMGLTVVQRPACDTIAAENRDDWVQGSRSVQSVTASSPPVYELVGLLSGVNVTGAGGGSIGQISETLESPSPVVRHQGFAPTVGVRSLF